MNTWSEIRWNDFILDRSTSNGSSKNSSKWLVPQVLTGCHNIVNTIIEGPGTLSAFAKIWTVDLCQFSID